jgi:ABC-type transport system involved in multi-copper enzyme maturation permease subunit
MIFPLFRYIFLAAIRDRFFLIVLGGLALILSLSTFFASSIVVEQDQFSRTFTAYGFRLLGSVLLIFFVVSHVRRSFEARDIECLLSRPVSRISIVITHAAAFTCLSLLAALILGGTALYLDRAQLHEGTWLWWISLGVEFSIMANTAMFFAFVVTSVTGCMAIMFGFYLLSRVMGEILGILQKEPENNLQAMLGNIMEFISIFIPRLDLMGQTSWILYGVPENLSFPFIAGQGIVFVFLVVGAAIVDMTRRQF